jgi:hypothetical protein
MSYEIADFHPETGHLHACTDRATCDCAAWLFCIAEDAVMVDRPSPLTAHFLGAGGCELHEVCRRGERQCPYHRALASSDATSPTAPADQPAGNREQAPSWPPPTTPQSCVQRREGVGGPSAPSAPNTP